MTDCVFHLSLRSGPIQPDYEHHWSPSKWGIHLGSSDGKTWGHKGGLWDGLWRQFWHPRRQGRLQNVGIWVNLIWCVNWLFAYCVVYTTLVFPHTSAVFNFEYFQLYVVLLKLILIWLRHAKLAFVQYALRLLF